MPETLQWEITPIELALKFTWRISRNASDVKTNFIVRVSGGGAVGSGEVAPNIRFSETPELIQKQFIDLLSSLPEEQISTTELAQILHRHEVCNSLAFGIQSAFLHYTSTRTGIPVAQMLGLPETFSAHTCFSLPVMPVSEMQGFITKHTLCRFKWLKVKVSKNEPVETILEVARITKKPLLIDGNEAWENPDELLNVLEQVTSAGIEFIEQPMPAACRNEYEYLKKKSPFPLFADESVTDYADFDSLKKQFHGINVKLMKTGDYVIAQQLLKNARANGLKTMIGCMIETSLGISSAMHLSPLADYLDLDGFLMLKHDPFGLLKENNGELSFAHK